VLPGMMNETQRATAATAAELQDTYVQI